MTSHETDPVLQLRGVSRRFRGVEALAEVSLEIPSPGVYGLLGRNGAGKSTLLRIIAGQDLPSSGEVRTLGGSPFENPVVSQQICLIREDQVFPSDARVQHVVAMAAAVMPFWNPEVARQLMQRFALAPERAVIKLSRGQRSALGCLIGLAGRAPLTMFDEPTVGLDAVARQHFQDALITELATHQRTILISTHLIEEVAGVLEGVIVLSNGRVRLVESTETLLQGMAQVSGPAGAVLAATAGCEVLDEQRLGSLTRVIVRGAPQQVGPLFSAPQLQAQPLSLQQGIVSLLQDRQQTQPSGAKP